MPTTELLQTNFASTFINWGASPIKVQERGEHLPKR